MRGTVVAVLQQLLLVPAMAAHETAIRNVTELATVQWRTATAPTATNSTGSNRDSNRLRMQSSEGGNEKYWH